MRFIHQALGILFSVSVLLCCAFGTNEDPDPETDNIISVPCTTEKVDPGISLPGHWRPFSDDSPWNTPISPNAKVHPASGEIIDYMAKSTANIRFGNYYLVPVWVVNADVMPSYKAKAAYPFDIWDLDNDFLTESGVPIDSTLWGEQTEDGHITLIDTTYNLCWEMSRFKGIKNGLIDCSTFNVWDLTGNGTGDPNEGRRWRSRGGRGSGFPNIAGLVRPEEIRSGEIRHALAFTFTKIRPNDFYYPASRSDGKSSDPLAPAEGMLFQLNPDLTEADWDRWGLSESARVVARALQKYGMYLCDVGGDFAMQAQLLDKDSNQHRKKWDELAPGMYSTITKIPARQFRIIDTGQPLPGGAINRVTTPLVLPQCGTYKDQVEVTIQVNNAWPNATIRYTLDGTVPTLNSPLYSGPFLINRTTEVRAIAFDPVGQTSHVMRAPFIICK